MPVVWERQNDIAGSHQSIPMIKSDSRKNFQPPATIESDFRRLLKHDVSNVNYTYEQVHNWYDLDKDDYEPVYIRGQCTPIDWKSKVGNSDMSYNFKTTHDVKINKGDLAIREDGVIFYFSWNIQNHPNNQATQATECNTWFEITRHLDEQVDEDGKLVREAKTEIIVPKIPGIHIEYAGRPDYAPSQGSPGINPDHLITCSLQWNDHTKNVKINDEFVIGNYTYRVINVSMVEVQIDGKYGTLVMNARRIAGGDLSEQ